GGEPEDLERPRLVALAGGARLVLPEGRRAVRRERRDHARAAAPDPRPEPPFEDVVAAAQPHVVRRHRLRRVFLDQRRERLDVVALEGIDVAGEERAIRLLERRSWIGRADGARRQRRAGALEG